MMLPPNYQIADFRTQRIRLFEVAKGGVTLRKELDSGLDTENPNENEWLQQFEKILPSLEVSSGLPLQCLLPDRLFLFKIFKIPASDPRKHRDLLQHEVTHGFPHGDTDLIWSYVQIRHDDIEDQFLVAVIRKKTFKAIQSFITTIGFSFGGAVPSLFYALPASHFCEQQTIPGKAMHFVKIEGHHGLSISMHDLGSMIRAFSIRSAVDQTTDFLVTVKSEIKKTTAALKRQAGAKSCGNLEIMCAEEAPDALIESIVEVMEATDLSGVSRLSFPLDSGDSRLPMIRSSALMIEPGKVIESRWIKYFPWVVAVMLFAFSPFLLVWGNHRVVSQYRLLILENNRQAAAQKTMAEDFQRLQIRLENLVSWETQIHENQLRQVSLLLLFEQLQNALQSVRDIWFETLTLDLARDESGWVTLDVGGKFLVRQSNLREEYRQQAISDAEKSLQKLQQNLMSASLVDSILDFKVNYSGIDQSINVVPFALKIRLKFPFSLKADSREVPNAF